MTRLSTNKRAKKTLIFIAFVSLITGIGLAGFSPVEERLSTSWEPTPDLERTGLVRSIPERISITILPSEVRQSSPRRLVTFSGWLLRYENHEIVGTDGFDVFFRIHVQEFEGCEKAEIQILNFRQEVNVLGKEQCSGIARSLDFEEPGLLAVEWFKVEEIALPQISNVEVVSIGHAREWTLSRKLLVFINATALVLAIVVVTRSRP